MLSSTRNRIQLIAAVALLTPLFLYWAFSDSDQKSDQAATVVSSGVDYFMRDTTAREFGTDGRLVQRLHATSLEHYPKQLQAQLAKPEITVFKANAKISAQSEKGTLFDNEDKLLLEEAVTVTHNPADNDSTQLDTSRLTLHHKRGIAETSAPVTFRSGQSITTATGMTVDYNTQISELHSNVEGTFHVDKK
ncbi:LPS export ABC transporter periplasmic protein LptC [Neptunomonas sp. XY-337]|uniref:LPS export ABC transporter periplasmic protein LptC n=1 Tax=Neptunomonas sp. XY-337 TaxID=2561897 RepID=UPI0010AA5690|nr:LPS export ABC transporter periplasmic protein LptC [Neptunomonas sp. XY-337]